MLVAISVAFTCALGTTAPEGSVTVPLIVPRKVCAFAAMARSRIASTTRNSRFMALTPQIEFFTYLPSPGREQLDQSIRVLDEAAAHNSTPSRLPCAH